MSSKTVLSIDVGSKTISAAVASNDNPEPQLLHPDRDTSVWPAVVYVAADGSLVGSADQDTTVISRPTRLLGGEAQIIAGQPRHADSLIAGMLAPVLRTAEATLKADIDVVAATYPSTWPDHIVDAYGRAVAKLAPAESTLVPWSDAIAAQTYPPDPFVDCPVTSLDFGARSASVTMVKVDSNGRTMCLYSTTHPTGGFGSVARDIVQEICVQQEIHLGEQTELWWETATAAVVDGRVAAERDQSPLMTVRLPSPLSVVEVPYEEVTDFIHERLRGVGDRGIIQKLVERSAVQGRWTIPGDPRAARPIVQLTGGFSKDPAVQIVVNEVVEARVDVIDAPEVAAAWGAAKLTQQANNRRLSRAVGR